MKFSNQDYTKLTKQYQINWNKHLSSPSYPNSNSNSNSKFSQSKIYIGRQIETGSPVAIKIVQSIYPIKPHQILAKKSQKHHPNILHLHKVQQDESKKKIYYILQYCQAGSLKDNIAILTERKTIKYIQQLLNAVSYIHSTNQVHCNINPDNIFLGPNDQIKLGLSRKKTQKGDSDNDSDNYNLKYSAPQILNQQIYNQKCDVWSLGVVLYQMLAKKELFQCKNIKGLKPQVNQFLSNKKQTLQLSSQACQLWIKLLQAMLTKQLKRLQIKGILEMFYKLRPMIEQQLPPQETESQIKLRESAIMALKNDQESKIKIYLDFHYKKAELPLVLQKFLTSNRTYLYLPNLYKYLLRFIEICICVSKKLQILEEIKSKSFKLMQNLSFNQSYFLNVIYEQFKLKIDESVEKHKIELNKIVDKILKVYMQREKQRKILMQKHPHTLQSIKRVKQGNFDSYSDYMKSFKIISSTEAVFLTNEFLSQFSQQDLSTYMWIRIIANLDVIFDQNSYLIPQVDTSKIDNQPFSKKLQYVRKINKIQIER